MPVGRDVLLPPEQRFWRQEDATVTRVSFVKGPPVENQDGEKQKYWLDVVCSFSTA